MKNTYAKDYYNTFLQKLPEDYKTARWFSSPAAQLDYKQTKIAIESALPQDKVESMLEIGPGDGVWTDLFIPLTNTITLLDQSIEMIDRAKKRLETVPNVSFIVGDFTTYTGKETYDMICAIRCFEYFENKAAAVKQFHRLLKPGGKLIIVTKNPEHVKMAAVQVKELHTGQIGKSDLSQLLGGNGFTVRRVLSATWRFKAKFAITRAVFSFLHYVHVKSGGLFVVPFVTKPLTESYLYVAQKR